jgi:hypothetical protein
LEDLVFHKGPKERLQGNKRRPVNQERDRCGRTASGPDQSTTGATAAAIEGCTITIIKL